MNYRATTQFLQLRIKRTKENNK
uniref:Photosystem II protein L n=1 Tax=Loropetalum subcordatum TaxID=66699 RepID=A0A2R3TVS4_9MAGN|nr:photosystem II protein L [Loropetalum subcordatum]AVQ04830.1 photosystem II protein L [Loropetalum subcordatum]